MDKDMTNREFAAYNGTPDNDIPENDIPENDVPQNDVPVMPMKKQAPMEKSNGWRKSALKIACKPKDGVLTFKDDLGFIQVDSKKIKEGTDTYRNLLSILQKPDATKWHICWFSDSNGVRRALEILTDEQYQKYTKAAWQNKKLYHEGFRTANPFLS